MNRWAEQHRSRRGRQKRHPADHVDCLSFTRRNRSPSGARAWPADGADRSAALVSQCPPPDLHWTERLRSWVLAYDRVHIQHPGLAGFVLTHRMESMGALQWLNSILEILRGGGLDEDDVLHGLNQLSFLMNPMIYLDAPPRSPTEKMFSHTRARRLMADKADRFPHVASMLDRMPTAIRGSVRHGT